MYYGFVVCFHMTDLIKFLEQNSVKFIDFRFTDLVGKPFSITYDADDETINNVKLAPDIKTIFLDPFCTHSTAVILCDHGARAIAKKAYNQILSTGIIDRIESSFKIWFSVFDEVKFNNDPHVKLSPVQDYLSIKRDNSTGYNNLNSNPDPLFDLRSEILLMMKESSIENPLYHKRVSLFQAVVKVGYSNLMESTDNIQKSKYIIRNVAHSYGKTATFMPNPIVQDSSNHLSLSHILLKDNKNLSDIHSNYIGGIMKHIKAINAYTNPTVNSYRKPFSQFNLSFPDAIANPYLCVAAILMAGLDGIQNKTNIVEEQPACSLSEALKALDQDRKFLLQGNVFTDEQIDAYIRIKQGEINKIEAVIHPIEFLYYYNM
jgi:glutamine synthetase